jgi:hypothetical protein
VGYSPDSNDVSTEAEESPLLRAITKQRLIKTLQAGENTLHVVNCKVWKSAIVLWIFVVTTCKWAVNPFTNPYVVYIVTHKS